MTSAGQGTGWWGCCLHLAHSQLRGSESLCLLGATLLPFLCQHLHLTSFSDLSPSLHEPYALQDVIVSIFSTELTPTFTRSRASSDRA
jgi:hypothetical protein